MNKGEIRESIWKLLEERNIADFPRPCFGRIPNFVGSRTVSEKVKNIPEFKSAKAVFCAPDFVLKRIREIVLEEGKVLAVALPHMTEFVEITKVENINDATSIKGFKKYGSPLKTKVDLFVQGSVAVDRFGNRLGKGSGYGDKEFEWLLRRGLIDEETKVVTMVHNVQVLNDITKYMSKKDKKVDYILTPSGIIRVISTSK